MTKPPKPTVTITATATVTATTTVTTTATPSPVPPQLNAKQQWGLSSAETIALGIAVVGWVIVAVQRGRDQRRVEKQRARDFLVQQLQRAAELYAEYKGSEVQAGRVAVERLRAYVATVPSPYASLLKVQMFGTSTVDKATLVLDEATLREGRRRVPNPYGEGIDDIDNEQIYREIADNIDELLGREGTR